MGVLSAILVVLGVGAVVLAVSGVRRVGASERLVVQRFGGTPEVRGPGLRYLLPLADTGVRVPLDLPPHHVWFKAMTRDGVAVQGKALATMRVADPVRYAQAPDSPSSAAQALIQVSLRDVIAARDLADLPALLDTSDDPDLVGHVNRAVRPWGIVAGLVAIVDATIPVVRDRHARGNAGQKPPKSPPPNPPPKSPPPKSQPPPMSPSMPAPASPP
ncbi:SPFH domain-containing protein [Actinomadura sp. 3N508]|uniref:SPFH domain-containing protein n=1 Tax=Actinomadura sp. 3N508 TaxID=3375153 RepID=UPI003793F48C